MSISKDSHSKQKHIDRTVIISSLIIIVGLILFLAASLVVSRPFVSGVLSQLGSLLLITGLFTLIYEYKLRQAFLTEMREEIKGSLKYFLDASSDFQSSGLVEYHESLPEVDLYKEFRGAKSIKILQIWTGTDAKIDKPLRLAAENGCEIKILLLDPASSFCQERSKDLGLEDQTHVSHEIQRNLTLFKSIVDNFQEKGNVEVKIYDATPTIPIYICDEHVYFGHKWRGKGKYSISTPYFKAKRFIDGSKEESIFWKLAEHHFEDLWEYRSKLYAQTKKRKQLNVESTVAGEIDRVK